MNNIYRTYWIHAVTPLHVGAGRGLGYIDLPVAREKVTKYPYVPGSSIKGVIAAHHGTLGTREGELKSAFGTANDAQNTANAGSIVFSDARLVCMPVRSFYGTFAWVTSPFCLERLRRDMKLDIDEVALQPGAKVLLTDGGSTLCGNKKVYFEDLDMEPEVSAGANAWAEYLGDMLFSGDETWRKMFIERFAVVSDDVFSYFSDFGTQVDARVRIDEKTGTASKQALWYEESLPPETILAGLVWCDKAYGGSNEATLMDKFCAGTVELQIGGNASTGKGRVVCVFENKALR